jgi:hypothetical protein
MDQVGEEEEKINESIAVKKRYRGLAKASKQTKTRVATLGGNTFHTKRGLQGLDVVNRLRIAFLGGVARALDKKGLSEAGVKGGNAVLMLYGVEWFSIISKRGGRKKKNNNSSRRNNKKRKRKEKA